MTILIVGVIACAIGFIFGLVFTHLSNNDDPDALEHTAANRDNSEEEIQDLKNKTVLVFMDRQLEINKSLHDFNRGQVEINAMFEHRIEMITRKLNALEQELKFRKEEDAE